MTHDAPTPEQRKDTDDEYVTRWQGVTGIHRYLAAQAGWFILDWVDGGCFQTEREKRHHATRLNVFMTLATVGTLAGIGAHHQHENDPQVIAARAEEASQRDSDRAQARAMMKSIFSEAEKIGDNMYSIDLTQEEEALELVNKHRAFDNKLATFGLAHFDGFKQAHPDLEVIRIIEPSESRVAKDLADAPNQIIVITRPKGEEHATAE